MKKTWPTLHLIIVKSKCANQYLRSFLDIWVSQTPVDQAKKNPLQFCHIVGRGPSVLLENEDHVIGVLYNLVQCRLQLTIFNSCLQRSNVVTVISTIIIPLLIIGYFKLIYIFKLMSLTQINRIVQHRIVMCWPCDSLQDRT